MPNARLFEAGDVGINYASFNPYNRISVVASPFSWLQASYSYTEIKNRLYSDNYEFSGNQTLKDKGFDIKIKLLNETTIIPQVALGFRDIGGTGLFAGEYLVFSKFYQNVDFSFGAGWGGLSDGRYKNPLTLISNNFKDRTSIGGLGGELKLDTFFKGKEIGLFGGFEYFIPNFFGARIKVEYDSTNFNEEGGNKFFPKSRLNYGFTFPISKFTNITFGRIKGNEFAFSFSVNGNFGRRNEVTPSADKYIEPKRLDVLKNCD